jgi:hypothetical protein
VAETDIALDLVPVALVTTGVGVAIDRVVVLPATVELPDIALFRNASKDPSPVSGGFIANTIPCSQCLLALQ